MNIHELNNFTGTLGSGAYLAIDDGTDTGKISSQGLLAATEARIDNIIAGPAPSAEEIVDARLGADGVTYASLGAAIRGQVEGLNDDIQYRTLVDARSLSSFPIQGGAFTGLYADVVTSPYYIAGLSARYAEFDCTIASGQTDFWVGVQVNLQANLTFIGINERALDQGRLRRVPNNTNTASILNTDAVRKLIPVGTSHVQMEIDERTFRVFCNGALMCSTEIPSGYEIQGLAFLNLGLVSGNIQNLIVMDNLSQIALEAIRADYITVTDDIITREGWSSFSDLPTNRAYSINLSSANYEALGFPEQRAGLFMCLQPYDRASTNFSFRTYLYVNNNSYEFTEVWICFGHGSTITPWSHINTYGGAGYMNPLAEAMTDNNNKVCFIGDSIIAGLGGTGYDVSAEGGGEYIMYRGFDRYSNVRGYCWVNEMIQYMADVYGHTNVKNRGVGGISTQEIYNNWSTLLDDANTVVLSCGTNDYNNLDRIITYLPQIAKACITNGVKLMVMTNTPNNTADANKYNAVKGYIVAVCNSIGIPVYDMYSEFEMYLNLKGISLSDVLNSDGIHPNDTGYEIMFEIAKKLFQI